MEQGRRGASKGSRISRHKGSSHEYGKSSYGKDDYKSQYDRDRQSKKKFSNESATFRAGNDKKYRSKKRFTPKSKSSKPWWKENSPPITSDLQITDGKHRGKFLQISESPKCTVTDRRLRQAMFRILFRQIRGRRFLDLCSGAGTVGIEAISRAALVATFVERSAKFCSFIKKNLDDLEIKEGHGEIFNTEVVPFLKQMKKRKREWDIVYYSPPFDTDYESVLEYLKEGVSVRHKGVLVVEHHAEMFFPEDLGVMYRWKVITEGETSLSFYNRKR